MTIATKNSYSAKEFLKTCGMEFNKDLRRWESNNFDATRWTEKMCNPTYNGRKNARICADVLIETI